MGDDLMVVNSARVSFNKQSFFDYDEYNDGYGTILTNPHLSERDSGLVRRLARDGHWTPFSHPQITLRETVPIFVARQRFKHMVGFTYNEVSRRYVDDAPEFYVPKEWRAKPEGSVKQGSGGVHEDNDYWIAEYHNHLEASLSLYSEMIEEGVAPEMARMVLPQSMLTSYYVTGSLAAFARAYKLRINPHSQLEIQEVAKRWDEIIRPLFPQTWPLLVDVDDDSHSV